MILTYLHTLLSENLFYVEHNATLKTHLKRKQQI